MAAQAKVPAAQLQLRGLSGEEVNAAFEKLVRSLTQAVKPAPLDLVTPGAKNAAVDAYWHQSEGYWVSFQSDSMGRHVCSYGTVNPNDKKKQTFVCQINVQAN